MRTFSTSLIVAWVLACGAPTFGCGTAASTPPGMVDGLGQGGAGGSGGSAGTDATPDAATSDAATSDVRAGNEAMSPSFGDLVLSDVADTPCVPARAPAVPLSEGMATASGFEAMGQLGDRRYAFGVEGSVVVTFGYDGASPSPPVLGILGVAPQNGGLAALVALKQGLGLQRYDALGAPEGSAVALDGSTPSAPSVGAGPTGALAVWCTTDDVQGRFVDVTGQASPLISLGARSAGEGRCRTKTLWNGRDFTVFATRLLHNGKTETSIAYVGLDGTLEVSRVVVLSEGRHDLIDAVKSSFGYVVLFSEGDDTSNPTLFRLDAFGKILSPSLRVLGSRLGLGVAVSGSTFALSAVLTKSGRAGMRSFDATGQALGPWVCLDDQAPSMAHAGRAAIGADDQGYAVVARMDDGSNWYMRTDLRGDGLPASD